VGRHDDEGGAEPDRRRIDQIIAPSIFRLGVRLLF
jgi:hypothetical protein